MERSVPRRSTANSAVKLRAPSVHSELKAENCTDSPIGNFYDDRREWIQERLDVRVELLAVDVLGCTTEIPGHDFARDDVIQQRLERLSGGSVVYQLRRVLRFTPSQSQMNC